MVTRIILNASSILWPGTETIPWDKFRLILTRSTFGWDPIEISLYSLPVPNPLTSDNMGGTIDSQDAVNKENLVTGV